ncbi:MAG: tetratricopeptide repeat protein, partial [Gemmatimonadota bacterium]|nr:tetratricopeptide repeat protein [Gemmatimonadota bacterium]
PEYAIAHCGLADTYCALGLYGLVPTATAYERAKASVQQAMAVDDTAAEVQYSRGLIEFFFGWNFDEAIRAFEDAIARNPAMASAHSYLSAVSGMIGDEVRALDSGPHAQELEPLSPLISTSACMGYYLLGRMELTKVASQQALVIDPQHNTADYLLALVDAAQGRYDDAIVRMERTAERMRRIPHILMFLGEILWKSGREDEARAVLAETYERSATGVDRPAAKAWLHMHMGELDKGFEQLELGAAQHDPAVPFLLSWPGLGEMRADPRYGDLLDRLGFTKYASVWQRRS